MAFPFIRKVRPSPSKTLEELIESFTLNIFGPAPSLKPSILKSAFDWFEVAPFDQSEIGDWGEAVAEMYVVVSTASGALVVGGVRDIYIYIVLVVSGDRFECSME